MEAFVFGTLATLEKRVARLQAESAELRYNHHLTPWQPEPEAGPLLTVTVKSEREVARVVCQISTPESAELPLTRSKTEWDLLDWCYQQVWQVTLPPYPDQTLVTYRLIKYDRDDQPIASDENSTFRYLVGRPQLPEWVQGAVCYQIFPDRFHHGGQGWRESADLNANWGGTIQGIIEKLPYLQKLGVTALWLTPFFPDHTHHGYHASDYFAVNPRMGTAEQMRQLATSAQAQGMKLILDLVCNHWGRDHRTFQEALRDPTSRYRDWYRWIEYPDNYETFFGVRDLPQLNTANPEVQAYLIEAALYWIEQFGFAGLRLDYAVGPELPFWTALRHAVKTKHPDVWIFGEVVEHPQSQLRYIGRFDGCFDFILAQALRATFGLGQWNIGRFDHFLHQHEQAFPAWWSRPSFLDNHDLDRFLFLAQNDVRKLKLAALCQFTLAGTPFLYQGTEIGVTQEKAIHDPTSYGMAECRRPMEWDEKRQDGELFAFYRDLIALRRHHPVLWHGARSTVHLDESAKTYAYLRHSEQEKEKVLVLFNLGEMVQTVTIFGRTITLPPLSGQYHLLPSSP